MRVTAHQFSHIGQMDENQDRATVLTSPDGEASLLVVADGLGGHSGAALAAQTVIETASRMWAGHRSLSQPEDFLQDLVLKAHAAVNDAGVAAACEPRTTLVALLVSGSRAFSVHAGDSRVMQLAPDGLVKQTLDHSVGRLNVMSGAISEEELASHPDQKKLFSHIGGSEIPSFEVSEWNVRSGCRFAVCSDGFWEIFPVSEVQAIFDAARPLQELEVRFHKKLSSLERHDNTTTILAELDPGPRPSWHLALLAPLVVAGLGVVCSTPEDTGSQQIPTDGPGAVEQPDEIPDAIPPLRQAQRLQQPARNWVSHAFAAQAGGNESGKVAREGSAAAGETPQRPVNIRPDLVLKDGESTRDAVEQLLRQSGRLGEHDALLRKGDSQPLGDRENTRFQQTHQGIPVFATEIVVTSDGRRVVSILGHTAPTVDVDTTPQNSYEETVALARDTMQSTLETVGEGSQVILALDDNHRLGWLGIVAIDGVRQRVILDASTGEILYREPATIG